MENEKTLKLLNPVAKYFLTLISMFRTNIRDYGMYIALFVIFLAFTILTGGGFLGASNFSNLLNQTAYVAVLAVGMTLVIVTRQIDLSVGYIGAFMGSFVVVTVEQGGFLMLIDFFEGWWPWMANVLSSNVAVIILTLLVALVLTILVGIIKGLFVAKIKVPSFVVTLAGMFIFKGLLYINTNNRTIPTSNNFFNSIGIGYLPSLTIAGHTFDITVITLVVFVLLIGLVLFMFFHKRAKNSKLGIVNEKFSIALTKVLFMSIVIGFIGYRLSSYKGVSWLLLITVVVVVVYHFITTQTVLGRRIYAVGGNPDAAELSGISVEKTLIIVFVSMGILALISGIMYASYVQNTSPNHGPFWELYAIAAAFIGGASAEGGVGKVVNAVIGAIVLMSLKNGMALAAVDSNIEPIVLGSVLLLSVVFDIYTRNVRSIDYVGIHYANSYYKDEYLAAKAKCEEKLVALKQVQEKQIATPELDIVDFEIAYINSKNELNNISEKIKFAKESDFDHLVNKAELAKK